MSSPSSVRSRTVLVANPSFDVYGADLQMLESVRALRAADWRVVVVGPSPGPLQARLEVLGAETIVLRYPVLRRADASPAGIVRLGSEALRALPSMRRLIRRTAADVVYVNTVTLPWWLLAARAARMPTVCHVHEAEQGLSSAVVQAMYRPLLLAHTVIANSRTTVDTLTAGVPRLRSRIRRIYNGVEGPGELPAPAGFDEDATRLVVVGRLSRRKAPDVALEAAALLVARGVPVRLTLVGTPVPGSEDYVEELHRRAGQPDLAGRVTFPGYVSPVWPALAAADVVLAPSTGEAFGNAVVEGQLAQRPVIATAVGGHLETVRDGHTGWLVPVGDASAFADAVARLVSTPEDARRVAADARVRALDEFGVASYAARVTAVLAELTDLS